MEFTPISRPLARRTYQNVTPELAEDFLKRAIKAGFALESNEHIDFAQPTHFVIAGHGITVGITYDPRHHTGGITILHKALKFAATSDEAIFAAMDKLATGKS